MQEVLTMTRAQEMQGSNFAHVRLAGDAFLITGTVRDAVLSLQDGARRLPTGVPAHAAAWYLDTFYRDDEK